MEEIEKKLWLKVQKRVNVLRFVPFLRMVAVCNNLSFGKVTDKSDIDLFVVAKSNHLFTVRLFITGLLQLMGVRRHGNKVAGRFCLSFFVDDSFLDLSEIALDRDIYLAFWIRSIVPVLDDGVSQQFFQENSWVSGYFENAVEAKSFSTAGEYKSIVKQFLEFILNGRFGSFVEFNLKKWQMKRARSKSKLVEDQAGLLLTDHILKFHNVDRRREYRGLWNEKFGESKITKEKFLQIVVNK